MTDAKPEKMVFIATHGPEDPERATYPLVLANSALVLEAEVTLVLQGSAVLMAKTGCLEHIFAPGLDPLKDLMETFLELGGRIWVCTPCIKERRITKEMLIEGAKPVTSGMVVQACIEADATLNY